MCDPSREEKGSGNLGSETSLGRDSDFSREQARPFQDRGVLSTVPTPPGTPGPEVTISSHTRSLTTLYTRGPPGTVVPTWGSWRLRTGRFRLSSSPSSDSVTLLPRDKGKGGPVDPT